jgi:hypothetical protein
MLLSPTIVVCLHSNMLLICSCFCEQIIQGWFKVDLVQEKVKPAEILCRLSTQNGEETLSCASVYDWCNKFSEGHEQVTN